jgi:hypothetical protein
LGQNSSVSFESAALVSSSGGRGNSWGGFRGNRGGRGFRGGSLGSGRTGGRGDRKCDHCGGTSHTEPYCWVKYGKPDYVHQVIDSAPQTQSTSTSSGHATSSSGSCDALTTQLSELIQQLHSTLPSSSIATLVDSCHVVGVVHSSPSWVIDSGTNKHIFGILSLFSDLFPIKHHIVLADGSSRLVLGKGVLHPTKSLSLPSILFVPDSPFNLLSVSQLTKALNCSITFDPTLCAFQDLKTKKMIGSGHEKNGLYYLDTNKSVFSTFLALSATVSPLQWHFRLGHPSLAKLKSAIPALSHVPSLECEACQLGKHHVSSFSSSSHSRQPESFDVVHTDIGGLPASQL